MRIFLCHTISTLFVLLLTLTGYAQTGTIKGKVTGIEGALAAATVSIGNKIILTNLKGEFLIHANPGVYTLTITHVGYKKFEQQIQIEANTTQTLDVVIIPDWELDEAVVLGSRSRMPRSNLNTLVPVDVFSSKS